MGWWRKVAVCLLVLVLPLVAAAAARAATAPHQPAPARGLDVSSYQHIGRAIDWRLLAREGMKFAAQTVALTGQAPIIYTMVPWWQKCTGGTARFRQEPLWLASYDTTRPNVPPAWQQWTFWQYDDNATLPGVGLTDLDFYAATAALPALWPVANKRTKLSPGAASLHHGTKAISNHQFGPHSHHKR